MPSPQSEPLAKRLFMLAQENRLLSKFNSDGFQDSCSILQILCRIVLWDFGAQILGNGIFRPTCQFGLAQTIDLNLGVPFFDCREAIKCGFQLQQTHFSSSLTKLSLD
jgi:hypothetical protein